MNTHIEIFRVAGIPIYLDMMFVLILIVFAHPYFTSGNTQLMSAGIIVVAGLLASILLHELGHALAGRLFKVQTREIEIGGLGGVARFMTSLPKSVLAKTIIFLAGPAANFLLWQGLGILTNEAFGIGKPALAIAIASLASANFWLMAFNLLPAYPLDGGRTLDAWLGPLVGAKWSVRIVGILGLAVTALCIYMALPTNFWMLLVAFSLFQVNWSALESVGGIGIGGRTRR